MKDIDANRRGWILVDFPMNREQTLALQSRGVCPKYVGKFNSDVPDGNIYIVLKVRINKCRPIA